MSLEVITSRNNAKIKEAFSYKDGKGPYFLVEGYHLVEMAIKHGYAKTVFSVKPYKCDVQEYLVSEEVIDKLAFSTSPEGIVALCAKKEMKDISSKRVMILDGLQDPGNVGTIIRGALAFSFFDVAMSADVASPYSSKAISASQGAIFGVNIVKAPSLSELIKKLKEDGYLVVGTSLKNAVPLSTSNIDKERKIAFIVGNEGKGVREENLALTDMNIRIEMDNIDSLNVAMASSILMYEYRL